MAAGGVGYEEDCLYVVMNVTDGTECVWIAAVAVGLSR